MLWKLKQGNTYIDMPEPSEYTIDGEDVDTDTYRSPITHDIIRDFYTKKWQKVQMVFYFKTEAEAYTLINQIDNYPLTCKFRTPIHSDPADDYWLELIGYISKVHLEMYNMELGYKVSFNFVEGER